MSNLSLDDIIYDGNEVKYGNKYHRHKLKSKSKHNVYGSLNDSCSVCLDCNVTLDTRLFPCKHAFHRECLTQWVNSSKQFTCPICRQEISHFIQLKPMTQNDEWVKIWNERHLNKMDTKSVIDCDKSKGNVPQLKEIELPCDAKMELNTEVAKADKDEPEREVQIQSSNNVIWNFLWDYLDGKSYFNNMLNARDTVYNYDGFAIKFNDYKIANWIKLAQQRIIISQNSDTVKSNIDIPQSQSQKTFNISDELLLNFKSGLCGGLFAALTTFTSMTVSNAVRNEGISMLVNNAKVSASLIPRMGIYFTGYECLKQNAFNVSDSNDNDIYKFGKRFTSAVIRSSISNVEFTKTAVKFSRSVVSLRFGTFFGLFEYTKDSTAKFKNIDNSELNFIDIFTCAGVSGTIASSLYYPMVNASSNMANKYVSINAPKTGNYMVNNPVNITNLYKGWGNHLIKWLPSCVVCSCAFEFSKRHFIMKSD